MIALSGWKLSLSGVRMKKRTFLKCGVAALAASAMGVQSQPAFAKKYGVSFEQIPALKKKGGSVTIRLAEKELLLIRISDEEVRGFIAVCPHKGCPVAFQSGKIVCDCHNSYFDLSGRVQRGPAEKPLQKVPVVIENDRIVVGDL